MSLLQRIVSRKQKDHRTDWRQVPNFHEKFISNGQPFDAIRIQPQAAAIVQQQASRVRITRCTLNQFGDNGHNHRAN